RLGKRSFTITYVHFAVAARHAFTPPASDEVVVRSLLERNARRWPDETFVRSTEESLGPHGGRLPARARGPDAPRQTPDVDSWRHRGGMTCRDVRCPTTTISSPRPPSRASGG